MASLSLYPQFETHLMPNRKVIELLLQLKSAKAHGKNNIKVKPHRVRHLLRNCLVMENISDRIRCEVVMEIRLYSNVKKSHLQLGPCQV